MYNDNKKWLADHAPGQVKGNVNYATGYGDPSKWQGNGQGASQAAGQSAQDSGLANTSDAANSAMTAANSPFVGSNPNQAANSPLQMMQSP